MVYTLNRPYIVRDFPNAPTTLRVPPELLYRTKGASLMGNYTTNCPPANLQPPTINALLLPGNSAGLMQEASGTATGGLGIMGLLGLGAVAWLLFGGGAKRNPTRNVAMGFFQGRGMKRKFHPIRASHDYDPRRAGEGKRKRTTHKRRRR